MAAPEPALTYLPRPGVTMLDDGSAVFCVFASNAQKVELCLFNTVGTESRLPMQRVERGFWAFSCPDIRPGQEYGFRVDGPWEPASGHRYNPAKLLLDPYARAIRGEVQVVPEIFGHTVDTSWQGNPSVRDSRDSAPFVPRSVVPESSDFDWTGDVPPRTPMRDSVVYELHVGGFTRLNEAVPAPLRGTYVGLAHPASVNYLTSLGVSAVELLPVYAFADEPHLATLGLSNYWGYNTVGFFAPHPGYATGDGTGAVAEFKSMVKALHAAGIEVILDVVYNHTAEQGGHEGPTLSLRGFDNSVYYRLDEGGQDIDVTGCGNSLDTREPAVGQLVLDSLRYWVTEMHVDGFRFDLAVTLGRGPGDDYDVHNALFFAMRTDPVLSRVKLIAEPWDIGMHGWRTGQFPQDFSEWNDRFRNTVRDFWLTDVASSIDHQPGSGVADIATRLAGSGDLFGRRSPDASVNYVTAHDGFTLADLVSYATKHNLANGEQGRDGTVDNRSWNHGVEGTTSDPAINSRRRRSMRNLLGTLILSSGVPMLTAGDEFARSQQGNNNAYCQNSDMSWAHWDHSDEQSDLIATVRQLISWRRRLGVLRYPHFFPGTSAAGSGIADLRWFDIAGAPMSHEAWQDTHSRTLQAFFDAGQEYPDSVLLVLHGDAESREITLPEADGVHGWELLWDSAQEHPDSVVRAYLRPGGSRSTQGASMQIFTAAR